MAVELSVDSLNSVPEHTWIRFLELLQAPLDEPNMLWFAVPLVIATLMMALYFGRYRREELGWNSAFGNTMVFIFISIDIIRQMYESSVPYSWMNILDSPLYLVITLMLSGFGFFSMLIIYYHLLPKQIAFRLFSNLPVNIAVYVIMCVVYAGVALDQYTACAGVLLFLVVWIILKFLQFLQGLSGKRYDEAEKGGEKKRGGASPGDNGESDEERGKHKKKKK